ncbi:hypothetical protein NL292_25850, partial [Klebsiella pneumoniae]|nr:hypothetical protein [Klebsiella pneumoniae]
GVLVLEVLLAISGLNAQSLTDKPVKGMLTGPSTYPCRLRVGPRQRPCKTRPSARIHAPR